MPSLDDQYAQLVTALRAQADLADVLQLLEWDQETVMPAGAIDRRARQIGALAALLHEGQTAPRFLALVDQLSADLPRLAPEQAVDVR